MAIEQHLVWNACAQLAERGERVTVRAVRAALGGGSPNEITPLVRSWRDAHLAQERERAHLDTMPPEVRARVEPQSEQLLASLWLALSEHSARQLEQMRDAYETATQELRQELADSQGLADDLAGELAQAQEQTRALNARLDATTAESARHEAAAREARVLAEERWRNLETQGAELRELRAALAEAQQRAARLEAERDHLRADLEGARQTGDAPERQAECNRLRQERDALTAALNRSETAAESERRQLEQALAHTTTARDKLHGHLHQVSEELRQLQASATVQQVQKLERELTRAQDIQRQAKAALDAGARKIQDLERALTEERQDRGRANAVMPAASRRMGEELQALADGIRTRHLAAPGTTA